MTEHKMPQMLVELRDALGEGELFTSYHGIPSLGWDLSDEIRMVFGFLDRGRVIRLVPHHPVALSELTRGFAQHIPHFSSVDECLTHLRETVCRYVIECEHRCSHCATKQVSSAV